MIAGPKTFLSYRLWEKLLQYMASHLAARKIEVDVFTPCMNAGSKASKVKRDIGISVNFLVYIPLYDVMPMTRRVIVA